MATKEHRNKKFETVACAIVTVSDTRTPDTDGSGALIRERLESAGHCVVSYEVIPDDPPRIREQVTAMCSDPKCQAVLLTGGTGLGPRDSTYEVVTSLFDKHLAGFGELFRMLSFKDVGTAAMLSRATAGVHASTVVFSMPGSVDAVRLAMDELIVPELGHLVWTARPTARRT